VGEGREGRRRRTDEITILNAVEEESATKLAQLLNAN
jgi:hypothetical protein